MASTDIEDVTDAAAAEGKKVRRDLRQTMLSGIALTVPFFITVLVLAWVIDLVSGMLGPVVTVLEEAGLFAGTGEALSEVIAAVLLFGVVFAVGLAAQHGPDTTLGSRIDTLMGDIPGIGSIYSGVERMSDVLVEGDTESFQEVKLVEFPGEGTFSLAFLTADTPREIEDVAGQDDMQTLFVPLAPNPVMGGHLVNIPRDRIYDVDLSVEEGMEAIMTTGIAIDEQAKDRAA